MNLFLTRSDAGELVAAADLAQSVTDLLQAVAQAALAIAEEVGLEEHPECAAAAHQHRHPISTRMRTRAPIDLTERELEVLRLLASQLSQPEIASALYVSINTLKTHTRAIYQKLGVSARHLAIEQARLRNLL
jgi:ATP/maltotriose-dependent transcriptional regulator MalT